MLHLWPLRQQWCSAETRTTQLQWPSAWELHRTALMELPSWAFCLLTQASCVWPQPSCGLSVSCVVSDAEAWSRAPSHSTEEDSPLLLLTLQSWVSLKLACLLRWFGWPHVSRTLIFSRKITTNAGNRIHTCGDEHKCFMNPFMNHVSIWASFSFPVPSVVYVPFSLSLSWVKLCKMRTWMAGVLICDSEIRVGDFLCW